MNNKNPIIIALNFDEKKEALNIIEKLLPYTSRFKVGFPLYIRYGNTIVEEAVKMGAKIFLDLKLHDIPSVVASAVEILNRLDIEFLTIHAQGGKKMLQEAQKKAETHIKLLGVTVLTSIGEAEFFNLYGKKIEDAVFSLASISYEAGLYGIVCSGLEVKKIKTFFPTLKAIVPGIRLNDVKTEDQLRKTSPCRAIKNGADFIVVGRDITHHKSPIDRIKQYKDILEKCN